MFKTINKNEEMLYRRNIKCRTLTYCVSFNEITRKCGMMSHYNSGKRRRIYMKFRNRNIGILLVLFLCLTIPAGCNNRTAEAGETPVVEPSREQDTVSSEEPAFSYSKGIDANGFWEGVKALDYVKLFDYKTMPIPGDVHNVTDESIRSEADKILAGYATNRQVTDRAVVDGDTVNIDYVGSVNGVPFDGGSTGGSGTNVTAGSTQYIDDFLIQIIGHKPGETFDVNVTFPEDYGKDTLNGKDAVFVTTINYIEEASLPEITDAFVTENLSGAYGWNSVDEMNEGLRVSNQEKSIEKYIDQYLTNEVTVSTVPQPMIDYQKQAMVDYYRSSATYYGVSLEEFISGAAGVSSVDELIMLNYDSLVTAATFYLVVQAVAEDAGLSVSADDLSAYFVKYAETSDYSTYEQQYGLPYLKQMVLCQKVVDYIIKNAVLQ